MLLAQMITRIHVRDFKCLRDVDVALGPLTVLIGKNDTGKTSFLEALFLLGRAVAGDTGSLRSITRLVRHGSEAGALHWTAELDGAAGDTWHGHAEYTLMVAPYDPNWVSEGAPFYVKDERITIAEHPEVTIERKSEHQVPELAIREGAQQHKPVSATFAMPALAHAARWPHFRTLPGVARALSSTILYRLDSHKLAEPTPLQTMDRRRPLARLKPNGLGLPTVLDQLLSTRRTDFEALERELCEALPQLRHIQTPPWTRQVQSPEGTTVEEVGKAIVFELTNDAEVPANLASDGMLLMLAYLTLLFGRDPPRLVLLEEPENGVHPHGLKRVMGYLRRLASPAETPAPRRAPAQVVVATHSPYLLDFVPPEWVRVFGRRKNGDTVVAPLDQLPGVKERIAAGLSLGELWFNVGEDELLKDLLGNAPAGE